MLPNGIVVDVVPMAVTVAPSSAVQFTAATLNNFLWVTFTRCNPSHDIHGINSFVKNKHWGCSNVIIDARIKAHHAPPVEKDAAVESKIDKLFRKGGSLYNIS